MKVFIGHPGRDKKTRQGLGRIDLLAVASITLLLAVVFCPALARTRVSDRSFQCLNNLRQLMGATLMYTYDFHDFFPPNPDDGNTTPYHNWCAGQAGMAALYEFNSDILRDPTRSMLVPYIATNVSLFHCPADTRLGRSTATSTLGQTVASARSLSMNGAVGTDPTTAGGKLPVNGPWLDGNHTHSRNGPWFTYGKTTSVLRPSPAMLLVLLDELPKSLNDSSFSTTMVGNQFLDCPGTSHNLGCSISFADGHAETKMWEDSRINVWPNGEPYSNPPNPDVLWLQERTSALK